MKNNAVRHAKALEMFYTLNTLREDCNLFSKLLLLESDKKWRGKHFSQLSRLQQQRRKRQSSILSSLQNIEINESWKGQLFSFSNRVYKLIKAFHYKLVNISAKMAEQTETNSILQSFRNKCIQKLGDTTIVSQFIEWLREWIHQKYDRQAYIFTGNVGKMVDNIKKEESAKINRYIPVIKDNGPDLFLECHRKALAKIDLQLKKLSKENYKEYQPHPSELYSEIMDLEDDNNPYSFTFQNGIILQFTYLEEGFCQFLASKWQRVLKELKNRNEDNQRIIQRWIDKYQHYSRKSKASVSKTLQRLSNLTGKEESREQIGGKSVELREIPYFLDMKTPINKTIEKEDSCPQKAKKNSIFRLNKIQSRKRSNTLRPLADFKQNNKQVIHQKVIEMKLVETPPNIVKNMRIRKRRPFPVFKDQNSWSILMRENHPSKIALCVH